MCEHDRAFLGMFHCFEFLICLLAFKRNLQDQRAQMESEHDEHDYNGRVLVPITGLLAVMGVLLLTRAFFVRAPRGRN